MQAHKDVSEVRSLLGMAQYSAQFIHNFAEITTPLRKLTHKDTKWKWSIDEQNAFEKLGNALSEESVLDYYKVGKDTRLVGDAGPNSLGCVLL